LKKSLNNMSIEELWELFPIVLKEHNPQYKEWYEIEKQQISSKINNDDIVRINHIGSSAVKGLISKPTVDILLEVKKDCDLPRLIDDLSTLGWGVMKKEDEPIKLTLNKGYTPDGFAEKVYHLHLRYYDDWDELYFRDYLIEHNDVASEYGNLKLNLHSSFEHDRDRYTDEKSDFVKKFTVIAKHEYKDRYKPT